MSKDIFELVHVDLWGLYCHKTHNNCNIFLTIMDNKSKATWVYLLSTKSHVVFTIQAFMAYVENQFSTWVEIIRLDMVWKL